MRYAFGLTSLLVAVAIMAWVFAKYEIPIAKKGKQTQEQVQPWSGKTADGMTAQQSIKLEGEMKNGQLSSLLVASVTPGGFYEQYFGLKVGDKILQINGNDTGVYPDESTAEAMVWQAGMGSQTLTVLRNGQKLTLTNADGTSGGKNASAGSTPAPAAGAPASPAAPANTAPPGRTIPGLPDSVKIPQ